MKEKAQCYKTSNMITINYLISKGYKFEEEILENIYEGKITYLFSFRTNQEGINDAIDFIKKRRANGEKLPFPEDEHTDEQMTFKKANKIRWKAIERCFPNLKDR